MARSRNIKPSFFDNDELAEIPPIGRLFFIGLWTVVDFKGEIEWRPKKIKAQVLPYDECDIEEIAINLDKYGFIRFYSVQAKTYLKVVNFEKHQNPHKNEKLKGSDVPKYLEELRQVIDLEGVTINRDKSGLNQDKDGTAPADSCSLIPNPLNLIPETFKDLKPLSNKFDDDVKVIFEYWCQVMNTGRSMFSDERKGKILARLKDGFSVDEIKLAIFNCSNTPHNMGQNLNNKKYNDIELICRYAKNVEGFRDNPGTLNNQFSEKTQANKGAFEQFIKNNQGDQDEH